MPRAADFSCPQCAARMVYFCCDACGETIKKLKLQNHWCGGHTFSCVDCCQVFDRNSAKVGRQQVASRRTGGAAMAH